MQFGDDWPGVFVRGDDAAYYAMHLETVLGDATVIGDAGDALSRAVLREMLDDLRGCRMCDGSTPQPVQRMRPFAESRAASTAPFGPVRIEVKEFEPSPAHPDGGWAVVLGDGVPDPLQVVGNGGQVAIVERLTAMIDRACAAAVARHDARTQALINAARAMVAIPPRRRPATGAERAARRAVGDAIEALDGRCARTYVEGHPTIRCDLPAGHDGEHVITLHGFVAAGGEGGGR
jgi:hypothetical protein